MLKKIYFLIATILMTVLLLGSVNFVFAAGDKELTDDEKAAFIVRDEWTGWVRDFTASLSELDQLATAKIYDDMDFYDMQYRFTEKYKKVPEYLDEDGKPTQKLKDMIKEKRKKIAGAQSREFLCFTAKADGVTISLSNVSSLGANIGKSSDGVSFTSWNGSAVTLSSGDKLYVWNKGDTLSNSTTQAQFSITGGNVEASGDAASMINFGEAKPYCFFKMFYDQTNLTSLPEVSLTNTADFCYDQMFYGCTGAKTGPSSLPAENIATRAYEGMFQRCSQLETVPFILAKSVGDYGCNYMFANCTALKVAPELPATTLNNSCYNKMFFECTGLVTITPTLPALTIPTNAYGSMFNGCTGITKTPYIKAKTIAGGSMGYMFDGCSALNEIHLEDYNGELKAVNVGYYVFRNVASSGTIYYPGPTEAGDEDSLIPTGWTKVSSN
ncbi:MAG: leucine-rich repeat protein [Lachnospiraceae bacterium]|nr:leucine-rich repeat protein [Lachnospiraceae bacterium]